VKAISENLAVLGQALRSARWRRAALAGFLASAFAFGFYLAQVYTEISATIEQRRAAMTSSIYSAPLAIHPGDNLQRLDLIARLDRMAYAPAPMPSKPGQYSASGTEVIIFPREFRLGVRDYPAAPISLPLANGSVAAIHDRSGASCREAVLEPEVIGHLLSDSPAERVEVPLDQLGPIVVQGLLATEDRFFYYHPGFDPVRIVEAAVVDLRRGHLEQGASTLTQQLARTFIPPQRRSFRRKFRELAITVVLEVRLSKKEILDRYINDVPMGEYHGAPVYGLPLAARYFFDRDLRDVTPAQAATLIGMIRAPTLYDPRRHLAACRSRRDTVLGLMHRAGIIDDEAYHAALAAAIDLAYDNGARPAPYFADEVAREVAGIPGFDGKLAGVKVYTTLDPRVQALADRSVNDNLERIERAHKRLRRGDPEGELESSLFAMEVDTGAILAMVGGRDYADSQFNRALSAYRQPGSAFKPIVYLSALDPSRCPLSRPLTLASILPDRPLSFAGWTPADYEGTYKGDVIIADAVAESLNIPTAYVGSMLGPLTLIRTAHDLGLGENFPPVLPIAIGAGETTLAELTAAYQVFAANGIARRPYAIESVVDGRGHLIYQHKPKERFAIRPDVNYLITAALEGVLNYGTGAGASAMGLDFPAAGKTGTTDDYRDAYFIGYTPKVAAGVWVGFDRPQSIGLTGAQAALPAWVNFMLQADAGERRDFVRPPGIEIAAIDPETGQLATASCPRIINLPFLIGSAPTTVCSRHGGGFFSKPTPITASDVPGPAGVASPTPPAESESIAGTIVNLIGRLFSH
jgi:penicillin-binding protein 1B